MTREMGAVFAKSSALLLSYASEPLLMVGRRRRYSSSSHRSSWGVLRGTCTRTLSQ